MSESRLIERWRREGAHLPYGDWLQSLCNSWGVQYPLGDDPREELTDLLDRCDQCKLDCPGIEACVPADLAGLRLDDEPPYRDEFDMAVDEEPWFPQVQKPPVSNRWTRGTWIAHACAIALRDPDLTLCGAVHQCEAEMALFGATFSQRDWISGLYYHLTHYVLRPPSIENPPPGAGEEETIRC